MKTSKPKPSSRSRRTESRPFETGFPPRTKVKLVYEDLITLAPGTTYSSYIFRGNSLFDPDYTGTGHQPRYFDQYSAVYDRYRVLSSKCEIEMINGSPTAGAIFSLTPNTEILTFTAWEQAAELPLSISSEIMPVASRYPFRLKAQYSTTQVCGLLPNEMIDEDWSALIGANPVQIWYWNVNTQSIDKSTNTQVSFRVRITYHAIMYERKDVGTS